MATGSVHWYTASIPSHACSVPPERAAACCAFWQTSHAPTPHCRVPGSQVFVISDFAQLDDDGERELSDIARNTELVLLRISDRLDAELPPPDRYAIQHGDQLRQIDTADRGGRNAFAAAWRARTERLAALARRARAPLIDLDTADNPLDVLIPHAGHARGGRV